ncbi:MAG: hypothetical protein ACREQ5_11535 [Candidatus Dormibacteria bacterium]
MRGDIPHPSENPHWPSWFYPPDTDPDDPAAHGQVFERAEDVPSGWAVHWAQHGVNLDREPPPAPDPGLTRAEVRAALTARDIRFNPATGTAELRRILDAASAAEAVDESV